MKKLIALIIAIITAVLFLASCGGEPETTTDNGTIIEEPTVINYASALAHPAVEMKSRVLLAAQTGKLYYYSKADGESYPFCFDPLCSHTYQENCPSILFNSSFMGSSQVYYNEYNNRVYIARGQQIYSTSFDASDLRLECSLGEKGKIEIDMSYRGENNYIVNLTSYENYLFFMYNNDKTGHTQIMRYDMNKRVLKEMTSATEDWALSFVLASGYIYVRALENDLVKYYTTDYDFKEKHYVNNSPDIDAGAITNPKMYVYDGEYFYINEGGVLYAFNPITGETEIIPTESDFSSSSVIWAVYDGYVYYQPRISGGYKIGNSGGEYSYRNICRVSMTGKTEEVLDMPGSVMQGVNFVSDGVIIFFMMLDMFDENENYTGQASMFFIHCDIAEDGRFINPKPLGREAENEQLIDYFASFNASSGEQTTDATTATTETVVTTETAETTETAATTETTATESTTEPTVTTEETTVGTTASTIDVTALPVVGEYKKIRDIEFKGFFRFPEKHALDEEHWYCKSNNSYDDYSYNKSLTVYTIAGYTGETERSSSVGYVSAKYYVYKGTYDEGFTSDQVYEKMFEGTPEEPLYGHFRFEVGEKYINIGSSTDSWLKIVEIDGVEWVYPNYYLTNLWTFDCAIEITDEYENLFYKPGIDDDIIAYLEENNIPNPTFRYKCRLDDLIAEMRERSSIKFTSRTWAYFESFDPLIAYAFFNEQNRIYSIPIGTPYYKENVTLVFERGERGHAYTKNLVLEGEYIYFIYNDGVSDIGQIIRYNILDKTTEEMTSAEDGNILSFEIKNGKIRVETEKNGVAEVFITDLDFSVKTPEN